MTTAEQEQEQEIREALTRVGIVCRDFDPSMLTAGE